MDIQVIIPTFNERENLPVIVRQVLERQSYRVLVVDDSSPDGTGRVADELAREFPGRVDVLHRTGRRGLGRSYVDALHQAVEGDADLVCQMDADLSHDTRYLPDMVAAVCLRCGKGPPGYLNPHLQLRWAGLAGETYEKSESFVYNSPDDENLRHSLSISYRVNPTSSPAYNARP